MICAAAYSASLIALQTHGLLPGIVTWLGLIFAVPTARQAMRLLLGKIGAWHLPTAIIGTSPMAQEVAPLLGRQLALGLRVQWVVPETPEKHLSSAFAGLIPLAVSQEKLASAL